MAKPIFTQLIERARAYVAVPSSWTRYTLALTRNNRDCEPTDAKAARFCAFGALVRAGPEEAYEEIYTLNDGPREPSRKAVLGLFDKSLARA